jgi:hypothetical protein
MMNRLLTRRQARTMARLLILSALLAWMPAPSTAQISQPGEPTAATLTGGWVSPRSAVLSYSAPEYACVWWTKPGEQEYKVIDSNNIDGCGLGGTLTLTTYSSGAAPWAGATYHLVIHGESVAEITLPAAPPAGWQILPLVVVP